MPETSLAQIATSSGELSTSASGERGGVTPHTPDHRDRRHATLERPVNRRPKLTIVAPNASPEEAAAVVAALERFMRETAPVPAPPPAKPNPWQQAALREGVARAPYLPAPWD
jgi:hypothetical protein